MPTIILTARAILFDMDGTLVDSTAVVEQLWGEFAAEFGLDVAPILATSHGRRAEDTVLRYAPAGTDAAAEADRLMAKELTRNEGVIEVPGAAAFVATLPADAIAVVTSARLPLVTIRFELVGIPLPATVVTAQSVTHGKPHPEGYLLGASTLGAEPADTIVFEDAEAGIRAGLAAGMRVIVVGELDDAITVGLPRITDYSQIATDVADGLITLTISHD